MKNLTTTIEKFSATTTISKTFEAKTPKGLNIIISVWRKIINVTNEPFETGNYFNVSYNGNESIGHYRMDREALKYYIDFIDKYSDKL